MESSKITLTYQEVKEALSEGYTSPLNHDLKDSKEIILVEVLWSESFYMEEMKGKQVTLDTYNRRSSVQAVSDNEQDCYTKTMVRLTLANGEVFDHRHDINLNYKTLPLMAA